MPEHSHDVTGHSLAFHTFRPHRIHRTPIRLNPWNGKYINTEHQIGNRTLSISWSNTERRYYRGFDLWNEFRAGYTVNFGHSPFYMNIQYLVGFGLVRGNKPADFNEGGNPVFRAPLLFVGYRF
jgi:hypothetical protein